MGAAPVRGYEHGGCPFLVDCRSVMLGAQHGEQWASAPQRPLARAWGPLAVAINEGRRRVQWMPAHCAFEEAERKITSEGKALEVADIYANRAADQHAKAAAEQDRLPAHLVARVRKEWCETIAVGKWIGVVSLHAQQGDTADEHDRRRMKSARVRQQGEARRVRARISTAADPVAAQRAPAWQAPARRMAEARRSEQLRSAADDDRALARWLHQRSPRRPQKRPAEEILAEVARRVRARCQQQP